MTPQYHSRLAVYGLLLAGLFSSLFLCNAAQSAPFGELLSLQQPGARHADFWIGETGPSGPIFTGPHQFPFLCTTDNPKNGLGQPLIDNHEGIGNAVFPEINGVPDYTAEPIGYSSLCSAPTRVDYFYFSTTASRFLPLPDPAQVPADVATIELNGITVNAVVRQERGTINRFIYTIAILAPFPESLDSPASLNNSAWNRKLIYFFSGGTFVGHYQGNVARSASLDFDTLSQGYAVVTSTGNKTNTHYNLRLAEETALLVKLHFEAVYGKPEYTVGIGASGGAVQQYVIGQNNPYIIDAAIPQLSYSDMVTQTIHIADCELLERYFDWDYSTNPTSIWGDWLLRGQIEGLATSITAFASPWNLNPFAPSPGSSECVNGWRGAIPEMINPAWVDEEFIEKLRFYRYPEEVIANVKWSHWDDLANFYPQDEQGFARNTLDNVGVQYGLQALIDGHISKQAFLELNACVGGWKQPAEMTAVNFPWNPDADPATLDPWHQENMNLDPDCISGAPAPRTKGDVSAMHVAYASGHVFTGRLEIPVIDLRHYLEPVLDMHHSRQSFATRQRMLDGQGHAGNHLIWFAECSDMDLVTLEADCAFDPTGLGLQVLDEWLANIRTHPAAGVAGNKPAMAVDTCFAAGGELLHAGADAWDGILDDKPAGPCTSAFPIHSSVRMVAGDSIRGDVFKCALKPVSTAVRDGIYAQITFNAEEIARLEQIFPNGICDYSQADVGKPSAKWVKRWLKQKAKEFRKKRHAAINANGPPDSPPDS